ncbi:MAG: hypothetical protein NTV58_11335 [Deltaproteobacteria bacterium]|nr:hypothetical protein [Deltaproteobacteria bacterium]
MTWDKMQKLTNIIVPVIGIGLMISYEVCDTTCSTLRGTFLDVDLKIVGILFMVALLAMIPLRKSRFYASSEHLQTMMLAGAVGGEMLLVRFQIVNDTYCPFCMAFGLCVLALFAVNFMRMNKYLALGAFCAGIGTFAIFFQGSILPLYG